MSVLGKNYTAYNFQNGHYVNPRNAAAANREAVYDAARDINQGNSYKYTYVPQPIRQRKDPSDMTNQERRARVDQILEDKQQFSPGLAETPGYNRDNNIKARPGPELYYNTETDTVKQRAGTAPKVLLLGHWRNVVTKNRKKCVMYKGELLPINEVRKKI